jgi:hypothetical protein
MKNLLMIFVILFCGLFSQAQVIDSLAASPSDTADGIDVDIVIFGSNLLEYINHDVSLDGNEINLTLCYLLTPWTAVDYKNQHIHIPLEPGNYNLNVSVYRSDSVDYCTYTELTDSTTVQISTIGISSPYNQKDLSSKITVYPNPIEEFVSIKAHNHIQINSLKLFDLLGKMVLESKSNKKQFELTHIKTGVYFLQIETNKGNLVKRIIKE